MTAVMASMVAATVNTMTMPSVSFTAKTERECGCQGDDGQHFFGDRQHD
ncbi:secreted protein [Rhodopirellula sp. SWK7]|nr:secreted protein [Rhodopirellula sp. SWK7]